MIVCHIGNIPPHSVPVVIREMMLAQEDTTGVLDTESSSSEESIIDDGSSEPLGAILEDIAERDSTEFKSVALESKSKRIQLMQMRNMEMEAVEEKDESD